MSSRTSRGFWDYVKAAFNASPQVPSLGSVPVNWLAVLGVGVLGLMNPGFWFIGAGLELAYLGVLAHNPRFRKVVDSQGVAQATVDWIQRKQDLAAQIDENARRRYIILENRCAEAIQTVGKLSTWDPTQMVDSLSRLTWIFLRLLLSRQLTLQQLREVRAEDLQSQIQGHEAKLAELGDDPARERLRKSIESTLEIVKKRLANLMTARDNIQFINVELDRIEQQVELMIQEFLLSRDVDSLLAKVDGISSTINETSQWMRMNSEVLSKVQDDDLDGPPALVLPSSPPTVQEGPNR